MERRPLGQTGERVSLLGAGGFHLLEISVADAGQLLNRYLDAGGNYIETAASYGDGASETKIARAVAQRRDEYLLASKVDARDKTGALQSLEQSLRMLQTDHLDIWFMHAVQTEAEADRLLGPGGALEAADEARRQGKVRFIGISGHGHPFGMLHALPRYHFDVLMVPTNYYDHFSFPAVQGELIPLAQAQGTAVLGMKAVADGYLWRSPGTAFRYAWSLPVAGVVAGFNNREMLEEDLGYAESFTPMSAEEIAHLYATAPEYRNYICRQCPTCQVVSGIHLRRIFELEGWYDRQLWDGIVVNPEDYALRVRLGQWFAQQAQARAAYAEEVVAIDPESDYTDLNGRCAHGLDINRKLKIAHAKLTSDWALY
ncbi:MAG TPA: aldo/keto reductase [Armatimonadota bacterium]|jgi:predicted aldo/keto reductase-like oxidoreductase